MQAVNAKLAIKFLEGNESSSVNNVLIFIFHIMHCQGCLLLAFNVVLNVANIVFVSYSEITKSQTRTAAGLSKLPMSINHSLEDWILQPAHEFDSDNESDDDNDNDDDPCPEDW